MSSSFIQFRNKGYWIADGFNELIGRYIVENIDSIKNKPPWLIEMRDKIFNISQGQFNGWNNFGFDDFLNDEPRVNYFCEILDKTISFLNKKGNFIKKEELNSYEMPKYLKGEWLGDVNTREIIDLVQKIKGLLLNNNIDNSPGGNY